MLSLECGIRGTKVPLALNAIFPVGIQEKHSECLDFSVLCSDNNGLSRMVSKTQCNVARSLGISYFSEEPCHWIIIQACMCIFEHTSAVCSLDSGWKTNLVGFYNKQQMI